MLVQYRPPKSPETKGFLHYSSLTTPIDLIGGFCAAPSPHHTQVTA